jgi:hypothetical protein
MFKNRSQWQKNHRGPTIILACYGFSPLRGFGEMSMRAVLARFRIETWRD